MRLLLINLVATKRIECNTFMMKIIEPSQKNLYKDTSLNRINFNREELKTIFRIYGRMVSAGEWRDYSISAYSSNAVFAVFRHSCEKPLYIIVKSPKKFNVNRLFSVIAMDGQIIKTGKDLNTVLQVFNKKLFKVVAK